MIVRFLSFRIIYVMKTILPLLLLISACSSIKSGGGSPLDHLKKDRKSRKDEIPVSSVEEARRTITNKRNFLTLLFEQSRDPYYGVPKWTEECLEENKIGDIKETSEEISFVSVLYLDSTGSAGHCLESANTKKSYNIYLFCKDRPDNILHIKAPFDGTLKESQSLCR